MHHQRAVDSCRSAAKQLAFMDDAIQMGGMPPASLRHLLYIGSSQFLPVSCPRLSAKRFQPCDWRSGDDTGREALNVMKDTSTHVLLQAHLPNAKSSASTSCVPSSSLRINSDASCA